MYISEKQKFWGARKFHQQIRRGIVVMSWDHLLLSLLTIIELHFHPDTVKYMFQGNRGQRWCFSTFSRIFLLCKNQLLASHGLFSPVLLTPIAIPNSISWPRGSKQNSYRNQSLRWAVFAGPWLRSQSRCWGYCKAPSPLWTKAELGFFF